MAKDERMDMIEELMERAETDPIYKFALDAIESSQAKYLVARRFLAKLGYKIPIEGKTKEELKRFMEENDLMTTELNISNYDKFKIAKKNTAQREELLEIDE